MNQFSGKAFLKTLILNTIILAFMLYLINLTYASHPSIVEIFKNTEILGSIILIFPAMYISLYFCFAELDNKNIGGMYKKVSLASIISTFIFAIIGTIFFGDEATYAGLWIILGPPIFLIPNLILASLVLLFYKIFKNI